MFKQTLLIAGTIGLSVAIATPAAAHSHKHRHHHGHQNYQSIQPIKHRPAKPRRVCLPGHGINNRQANQKNRIKQGKRNGGLVRWEVKQLKQQQQRIASTEQRMRSDGCLTKGERQDLTNRLNRASNKIRNLRQNNVRKQRHGGRGGYGHSHGHHGKHGRKNRH